jgi:hypothetical protein
LLTLVVFAAYLSGLENIENLVAAAATVLGLFLLSLSALGLSVFLFAFTVQKERRSNREMKSAYQENIRQRQLQTEETSNRWNTAIERWNQLYYCGRDDCVFLPGSHTHAPVSAMVEYLYRI